MTVAGSHSLEVTHVPLGPGGSMRVGTIAGANVNLSYLTDILKSHKKDMEQTEGALHDPNTRDLAEAVRAALLGIQSIAYHLLEVHDGVANGNLNYFEEPVDARARTGV